MAFFLMRVAYILYFTGCSQRRVTVDWRGEWWTEVCLYKLYERAEVEIGWRGFALLKFFSKKYDKIGAGGYYGFLSYINLITFYETFLRGRLYLINRVVNNSLTAAQQSLATRIYLSVSRLLHRSKIQFRWYGLIYVFVWTCVSRDLTLLVNYLTTKINCMHFKKHKKFFSLLRYIYFCVFKCLGQLGFILGFLCKISGKIGLAGSVKTKSLIFAYGRTRLSNKGGFLKTAISQIWTRTGVLGLRMYLIY